MTHLPNRPSNGIVVSICLRSNVLWQPGVVFAGTDRKKTIEQALALTSPEDAACLRKQLGGLLEADVVQRTMISAWSTHLYIDPCEIVEPK